MHCTGVAVPLYHRPERLLRCLFVVLALVHAVSAAVASAWEMNSLAFSQELRPGVAIDTGAAGSFAVDVAGEIAGVAGVAGEAVVKVADAAEEVAGKIAEEVVVAVVVKIVSKPVVEVVVKVAVKAVVKVAA